MLIHKLQLDLNEALKSQDHAGVSALRLVLSNLNYRKIELQKELTDEDIFAVMKKMVKQHEESIEMFKKGNRDDLVKQEEAEKAVLAAYLPKEMSDEELDKLVRPVIEKILSTLPAGQSPQAQMGRIIGQVIGQFKGKADSSRIAGLVKKHIN